MEYGQIAGSTKINSLIYRCFEYICEEDTRRFVRQFRSQSQDQQQVLHTLRELVLGAYLASRGLSVRYEYKVDTKTPDWCVVNQVSDLTGIVELVNFQLDKAVDNDLETQMLANRFGWVWADSNDNRLYDRIWKKAGKYDALAKAHQVPYIIAVFGELKAAVDSDELDACLLDGQCGLFKLYPAVSGILFFKEVSGRYYFTFWPNPSPLKEMFIPSDVF